MKKIVVILLLAFAAPVLSHSQTLNAEEQKLYELIMAYRKEKGLPEIPLSKSMTTVAQTHVKDLVENKPDTETCNIHSWSGKGPWSTCCYTDDHKQATCMWDKPAELTSYKGKGYEIAVGSNLCCSDYVMTAEYAIQAWKDSAGHNAVMINLDNWGSKTWKAIGIGLYKGFAVVWFGEEVDV